MTGQGECDADCQILQAISLARLTAGIDPITSATVIMVVEDGIRLSWKGDRVDHRCTVHTLLSLQRWLEGVLDCINWIISTSAAQNLCKARGIPYNMSSIGDHESVP